MLWSLKKKNPRPPKKSPEKSQTALEFDPIFFLVVPSSREGNRKQWHGGSRSKARDHTRWPAHVALGVSEITARFLFRRSPKGGWTLE
jgi:hypothetical protein